MRTTWQLWHVLKSPPSGNALFQHTLSIEHGPHQRMALKVILALCALGWAMYPHAGIVFFFFSPLFLILFSGTFYGLMWTMRVANNIYRKRQQGAYDLLTIAPTGALRANWAMCAGSLHGREDFKGMYIDFIGIVRMLFIFDTLTLFGAAATSGDLRLEMIQIFFVLGGFLVAIYIDYVQSAVLSGLVGIVSAVLAGNNRDTKILAALGFLVIQIFTYLVTFGVCLDTLPDIYARLGLTQWISGISLIILQLAIFYTIREVVFMALWRLLVWKLNTEKINISELFAKPV